MGLWNSHTSLGNILGSLVAGAFVNYNWGLSFTVPGMIIAGVGFLLFVFMVPKPADVGLTEGSSREVEPENAPLIDDKSSHDSEEEPFGRVQVIGEERAIGFYEALRIPGVIEFSLCLFFCKLVSYTFLYWLPNYIHSTTSVEAEAAAQLSTVFDMGGIVGAIAAGLLADKSGKPATTCSFMLTLTLPLMFLYQSLVSSLCPVSAINGSPVNDSCFKWNILLLLLRTAFISARIK